MPNREILKLSEYFGVSSTQFNREGAFNAIIGIDSGFYLDPTLLKRTKIKEFLGAYKKITQHYERVFTLLKLSQKDYHSKLWKTAVKQCTFPEPKEAFLGYSQNHVPGKGIGKRLAEQLLMSAEKVWELGIDNPDIFAILGILEEGFGADRISDMSINIIYEDLLAFSQRVTKNLALSKTLSFTSYSGEKYLLPQNPLSPTNPILLIPKSFLRPLPAFDKSIWDMIDNNSLLRNRVNTILGTSLKNISKKNIKNILLSNKEFITTLLMEYKNYIPSPYDFSSDPLMKSKWLDIGRKFSQQYPIKLTLPSVPTDDEIKHIISEIIFQFRRNIENHGVNKYLYTSEGKPQHEDFIQKLFFITAQSYCKANNLDLNPEVNQGSGAVDFKMSNGFNQKFLVELKLDKNTALPEGYAKQLLKYAECEETINCFYVVVKVSKTGRNIKRLEKKRQEMLGQGLLCPDLYIIDGTIYPTASKLR